MSTGIIDIIKKAAMDATDDAKLTDLRYGTVVSASPLKVQLTNNFTLPAEVLIVPRHLTNYTVTVNIDWVTENIPDHTHDYSGTTENTSGGSDEASFESHNHAYSGTTQSAGGHNHGLRSSGTKTITMNNALKVGDKVALLRQTGGQSYYVLDKI